ncbi:MAG TPA: BldC family transcriptional regulator [Candidatus Binatia bacterium]|nr:BldC family transcriptional regulator [Candidatus Binatia bacterium]
MNAPDEFPNAEDLMTPGEVADVFRVDPKTVGRWAKEGRLDAIRTIGGHRRFRRSQIRAILNAPPPVDTRWPRRPPVGRQESA